MNATPLLASAVLMLAGAGCESDHSEASYRTTPPGDVFRSDTSTDRTTYSYPTDRTATGGSVSTANDVDRTFVSEAISGGLFEVQSSQLALDHSGLDANNRRFAQMMNAYSIPEGQEIAERFDFTPYHCVLDVAGGPGGMVVQIGLRYPHLRGIIMDMAPVCEVAEEYIQASGLTGRFATAAADLFTGPYPQGADVIVLGHILHSWSDESCRTILRNCFAALPPQGVLLVSQKVLNNDFSGPRFALMLDLTMLVTTESGARERSEAEYRSLLEEAGFRDMEVIRIEAPRDLIVARKP